MKFVPYTHHRKTKSGLGLLVGYCANHADRKVRKVFLGFSWAQGIGLIDAAHIAARQPTEGVEHEGRKSFPQSIVTQMIAKSVDIAEPLKLS